MKIAAVVPTHRGFTIPEQSIPVTWYIVHDREVRPIKGESLAVVAPDPAQFGYSSDCIRSAGFLAAYLDGADYILTTDDDCFIPPRWAEEHYNQLRRGYPVWSNTMALRARGLPYHDFDTERPCALSHGLWDGVPDLDGITQESHPGVNIRHSGGWETIHPPFPQSAMNFGFRREVTPAMYQPAQGPDHPFDRFADIWGGLLGQRVLTLHGYSYRNGGAVIHHNRASDLETNKRKEAPGIKCHEHFWPYIWAFNDRGYSITSTYAKLAWYVERYVPESQEWRPYFKGLKERMLRWLDLLEGRE